MKQSKEMVINSDVKRGYYWGAMEVIQWGLTEEQVNRIVHDNLSFSSMFGEVKDEEQ